MSSATNRKAPPAPLICPKGALFLESESNSPGGRGVWYARVPAEHTIEHVLHPAYFGLEQRLQPGDLIDIEPESALYRVQVRVMAVMPKLGHVKTREAEVFRQNYEVDPPAGFRFIWEGEQKHWAIYKGETCIDAGFVSQDECLEHVNEAIREKVA